MTGMPSIVLVFVSLKVNVAVSMGAHWIIPLLIVSSVWALANGNGYLSESLQPESLFKATIVYKPDARESVLYGDGMLTAASSRTRFGAAPEKILMLYPLAAGGVKKIS